jgi:hypothetical protein
MNKMAKQIVSFTIGVFVVFIALKIYGKALNVESSMIKDILLAALIVIIGKLLFYFIKPYKFQK